MSGPVGRSVSPRDWDAGRVSRDDTRPPVREQQHVRSGTTTTPMAKRTEARRAANKAARAARRANRG